MNQVLGDPWQSLMQMDQEEIGKVDDLALLEAEYAELLMSTGDQVLGGAEECGEEKKMENTREIQMPIEGSLAANALKNSNVEVEGFAETENLVAALEILRLGENNLQITEKDREDMRVLAEHVVRWRLKASEILSFPGLQEVENLEAMLDEFRKEYKNAFPFNMAVLPEVVALQKITNQFHAWLENNKTELDLIAKSKSRRRAQAAADQSKQHSGQSKDTVFKRRRVDYNTFKEMLRTYQEQFPKLTSPETRALVAIEKDVVFLAERADSVLSKINTDQNEGRPSIKSLQLSNETLKNFCEEAYSLPIVDPTAERVEKLFETASWHVRAVQRLLASSSRSHFMETGASPSSQVAFSPGSSFELEEIEELHASAERSGIPLGPAVGSSGTSDDENLLVRRLERLIEAAYVEREIFQSLLNPSNFDTSRSIEDMRACSSKLQQASESALTAVKNQVMMDEFTENSTGSWFPERDAIVIVSEVCSWYVEYKEKFNSLVEVKKAKLESLEDVDGRSLRPDDACKTMQDLLEGTEEILQAAKKFDIFKVSKRRNKILEEDSVTAVVNVAVGPRSIIRELFDSTINLKSELDSMLQERSEDWKRSIVNNFIEVDWEGVWYTATIATYSNLEKCHVLLYENKEVETVIFDTDGSAVSPEGDKIEWRSTKKRFKPDAKSLAKVSGEDDAESPSDNPVDEPSSSPSGSTKVLKLKGSKRLAFATSIVGKFVKVEWGKGQYFLAKVCAFDKSADLHTVVYQRRRAEEQILLHADGTAQSESGEEKFRWVNTSETFDADAFSDSEEEGEEEDEEQENKDDQSDYQSDEDLSKQKRQPGDIPGKSKKSGPSSQNLALQKTATATTREKISKEKSAGPEDSKGSRRVVQRKKSEKEAARDAAKEQARREWQMKRTNAIALFTKFFQMSKNGLNSKAIEDVASLGQLLDTKIAEQAGRKGYAERVRTLYANLRKNEALRENFLTGKISAEQLCGMSPTELAAKDLQDQIRKDLKSMTDSNVVSAGSQSSNGVVKPLQQARQEVKPKPLNNPSQSAPTIPSVEKKTHIIDLKLEAQAAAKASENMVEVQLDQLEPPAALPSLQSLISFETIDPDEVETAESMKSKEDSHGGTKRKYSPSSLADSKRKKPSSSRSEINQISDWKGNIKEIGPGPNIQLSLAPINGAVVYGPGVRAQDHILPSIVLGLLGMEGASFKLAGRARLSKAVPYIKELVEKCDRQLILAKIEGVAEDRNSTAVKWMYDLEDDERVGVIDQGKGGLMVYLVPFRLASRFDCLKNFQDVDCIGVAILIVKPHGLGSSTLSSMRKCDPLAIDKTVLAEQKPEAPSSKVSPVSNTHSLAQEATNNHRAPMPPSGPPPPMLHYHPFHPGPVPSGPPPSQHQHQQPYVGSYDYHQQSHYQPSPPPLPQHYQSRPFNQHQNQYRTSQGSEEQFNDYQRPPTYSSSSNYPSDRTSGYEDQRNYHQQDPAQAPWRRTSSSNLNFQAPPYHQSGGPPKNQPSILKDKTALQNILASIQRK